VTVTGDPSAVVSADFRTAIATPRSDEVEA